MWQEFSYKGPAGSCPYFVYTPQNYQVGIAAPLVVMLHGCTQTALDFATGTQMNVLADQYQFIVAYPQQISSSNRNLCWNWFRSSNQFRGQGEPAILAGIVWAIKQQSAQWTIDASRIYVAGISAGGAMTVILGATYPDLFAAIGVHSGIEYGAATNTVNGLKAMRQGGPDPLKQGQAAYDAMAPIVRAIPTIVFQGTNDAIVNPLNGDQVVQQWMQTDRLASNGTYDADFNSPTGTRVGQVPAGRSYTVSQWNDDNGSELQEYWRVDGMGHAWSGGNPASSYTDPLGPSASLAIYQFFMNYPMGVYKTSRVLSRQNWQTMHERLLKRLRQL